MNNTTKVTKEKRGVYLTIGGRRVKIPYKDLHLFHEAVMWASKHNAKPRVNFNGFSIKMERSGKFRTSITLYTPRKEYSGTILNLTLYNI